ncbi:hypothetical protein D9613_002528 [Agrocybe pediades]|uniref:DUF6533 domain-containing protein n=1 Tax=Agrocybe pediades TaxID=84607 RepID=A0A8H4QPV4_9AGAR|nr:hypothetical protein D9613_002528 [Agrocybe pediades]
MSATLVAKGAKMALTSNAEALKALHLEQLTAFVSLSTAVCAVYDYVITLHLEVEYVWHHKPTVIQALFVVNRYLGLAYQVYSAFVYIRHVDSKGLKGYDYLKFYCMDFWAKRF